MLGLPDGDDRVPVRHGRRDHPDREGARRGLEGDVRRVPAVPGPRTHNQPFVPFDPVRDYDEYVDGKPRLEGTASFLESRGIELPAGRRTTRRARTPLGPEQQEERPHAARSSSATACSSTRARVRYVEAVRAAGLQDGDRVVKREHRGGAQGGGRGGPVRGPRRPPGGRGAPPARQARARHVPRGGADARRRRRRTRPSSRTRSPGWPPGERGISGSSWAWTGSARPTSSARTARTSVVKDLAELL